MSTPRSVINVPVSRLEQVRTIAAHRGVSMSELISIWVARDCNELGLPNGPKAYLQAEYTPNDGKLSIHLNQIRFAGTPAEIASVADAITRVATAGGTHIDLDLGYLEIKRQGGGVKLVTLTGEVTVSAAIAKDIARELRASVEGLPIVEAA